MELRLLCELLHRHAHGVGEVRDKGAAAGAEATDLDAQDLGSRARPARGPSRRRRRGTAGRTDCRELERKSWKLLSIFILMMEVLIKKHFNVTIFIME